MRFQVLVDGEPRSVELVFGGEKDLPLVNRWCAPAAVAARPGVRDTSEFAHLASKRWRYYRRTIATATSLGTFKSIVSRHPQAQVSLLLLVRADWYARSRILGLAKTIFSSEANPWHSVGVNSARKRSGRLDISRLSGCCSNTQELVVGRRDERLSLRSAATTG
jgi:hypothetical protein